MVEQPVGGRPSRNRKRPTDHVGAYPRARAFPAVPPSPPLVMQRHRILSCDGEAARRVLVPKTDFTLLSPSGRAEIRIFSTRPGLSDHFPSGENRGGRLSQGRKNLLGRWRARKEGGPIRSSLRFSETGAEGPGSRPLERPFSGRERASAAFVFGPAFRARHTRQRAAERLSMESEDSPLRKRIGSGLILPTPKVEAE